jgi:cyclopropane fatty-acyl-phospholipid synthase-like methyltransferase
MSEQPDRPVASSEYSEDYFLTACDGHEEYLTHEGTVLARRLEVVWRFLDAQRAMRILDIGCGRGEMVVQGGLSGIRAVGLDYSPVALRFAQRAIARAESLGASEWIPPTLSLANAMQMPFQSQTFDRVIMSDIVEHLYLDELTAALQEVHRVLVPGGQMLIHTMPNLWYYRYGYPLFRLVRRLQGVALPRDPRSRHQFPHVHVNEQTPFTLRRALDQSPFSRWHVWLHDYRRYDEYGPLMSRLIRMLTSLPVLKQVFCDDLFALARK